MGDEREMDKWFLKYYKDLDIYGEGHMWNVWSCLHKILETARRHENEIVEAEIGRRVKSITKVLTR